MKKGDTIFKDSKDTRAKSKEKRSSDRDTTDKDKENKKTRSSVEKSKDSRRRTRSRSGSPRRKRRERSSTPKPTRIHIGRLTRNVNKDHVIEIFSTYGEIKNVEFPIDRFHPPNGRGFAYVEFVNSEDAEAAMKHMDGGQIDGQEITAAPVLLPKARPPMMRRSPPMRNRGPRWRNNSPGPRGGFRGGRGRSPPMRRSPRRRRNSRSPIRRRRPSNSSDSSR